MNKYNKKVLKLIFFMFVSVNFFTVNLQAKNKVDDLGQSIDAIISKIRCSISMQIVSADKYDLLYGLDPQKEMIPASITKLITAAAAINVLGVDHDFKTIAYTDDNDISDGVINGNLYLKGYGDPDLSSSDIIYLSKLITEKGIREITGNIVYDESYLDDQRYGIANYYKGDTDSRYWPYISAINLNKNPDNYDPASSAANLLAENLVLQNVKVSGIVIAGVTPTAAKEIAFVYHSMFNVLSQMNKESDNHSAITLFKVIGAKYGTPPGSIEKGEEAVEKFLTSMGNPRSIFQIVEGSGLSRYNIVNSDLYVRLLKYMYDESRTFDYFYGSLAIAGKDGTLKNRMIGTEAEKNVHAKTGTLNSVSTLAGYAVSRDNELIIFYIAMNGFGGSANSIRYTQDEICEYICGFSRN